MSAEEQIKILDKVKKLLALGQSPNEAEASLAVAKAHELLKQYNLSLGDIRTKESDVVSEAYLTSPNVDPWRIILAQAVAKLNYCDIHAQTTAGNRVYHVFGKPHNVIVATNTADYLFETIDRLARAMHGFTKAEIESYKTGIGDSLTYRIRDMMVKDKMDMNSSGSKALVVQERSALDKFLSDRKASDPKHLSNSPPADWNVYAKGKADGKNISLNTQVGKTPSTTYQIR